MLGFLRFLFEASCQIAANEYFKVYYENRFLA